MTARNNIWILILVCLLLNSCQTKSLDEIILVPENYEGDLILILNQPDGLPPTVQNKKLITKFTDNGIKQVDYNSPPGWHNVDYFYYDKLKDTTKLEKLEDQDFVDSSKIYVLDAFPRSTLDTEDPLNAIIYIIGRPSEESKLREAASKRFEELRKRKTIPSKK